MNDGIDTHGHDEDMTYAPIDTVIIRRADLAALRADLDRLSAALKAVQADDAALRQRLAEMEALANRYGAWMRVTKNPCTFSEWRQRIDKLMSLVFESAAQSREVQP